MTTTPLTHVQRVIQPFGSQAALARLLGKRPSVVSHWVKVGRIPSQWHRPLLQLAHAKGIVLPVSALVGVEPGASHDDLAQVAPTIIAAALREDVVGVRTGIVTLSPQARQDLLTVLTYVAYQVTLALET